MPCAVAAVFLGFLAAGVLDQDAVHGLGRGGDEVAPPGPVLPLIHVHQPQVSLMHQGRACSVWPGFSWASLWAASLRSSS